MESSYAIKKIEEFWDQRASVFDQEHDTEDLTAWKKTLERLLCSDKNKSVLDLGTGTGFLANMSAQLGYATIGLDISREMLSYGVRHAKNTGSNAVFMEGNVLKLPFMDNAVDFIINARLIWTLVQPDQAIREWLRVLKPGGKICCFNRMQEGKGLTASGNIYGDEAVHRQLEICSADMQELTDLMERNGLVDVEIRQLPGLTRPGFDYEPWYVLMGSKPLSKRDVETDGMAQFWNKSAKEYEAGHALADHGHWKKVLSGLIGPKKEIRILDIATGTGMIANMLGELGYQSVIGADLSDEMMKIGIAHARELGVEVTYQYANALELPYENESFDVVINSRLLWTLTEPESALTEWKRVLKPDGKLIAINEVESDGIRCGEMAGYQKDTQTERLPYSNVEQQEILSTIKEVGFQEVEMKHLAGCRLVDSDKENWFAFCGIKK